MQKVPINFHPSSNMSYPHRMQKHQIQSHHRVFSYDISKQSHHRQNSSSFSSSLDKESHDKINSDHQRIVIERMNKDEQSSESKISSDNETENFIRAEFSKYQVKRKEDNFKLFPKKDGQKKKSQAKSSKNIHNQDTAKQPNTKKHNYETAYFQIQIQYQPNNDIQPQKFQQKPILKQPNHKNPPQNQAKSIHRYSQLEHLQTAIMHTLKQKEKQIFLLQNDLVTLNEQKLFAFKLNQKLQNQLMGLKKKTAQIEQIKQLSRNKIDWKPQTVQQMKIMMENQKFSEELEKLQNQQQSLKQVYQEMTDEQKVLRESLQTAFKTRRDYIKALTRDNQQESTNTCMKHYMKASNTQISRQTILKPKPFSNKAANYSKTIEQHKKITRTKTPTCHARTQNLKIDKQLSSMKEKDILLKLVQDFNELKNKVDESLILKSKEKPRTKSNMSTEIKAKRRVVFNRI